MLSHGFDASSAMVKSGSPRSTTSHFVFRSVAAAVADPCGPMATFTAEVPNPANHSAGTRSSGGGHRQNKYEGAVGITRKSGANAYTRAFTSSSGNLSD